jgi:hypothetical protein
MLLTEGLRVSALSAAAAAAAAAQAMGTLDFPYFHVEQTTRLNLSRELLLGVMCAPPLRSEPLLRRIKKVSYS